MKISPAMVLAGLAVCSPMADATPEGIQAPAAQQPGRNVEALVRELADENFQVREKATRELWEVGEAALPALKEAAESADPEQVFRAQELLRKIQLHITPDTDPSVIALVERYISASPSEKADLFGKMRQKRAWRQMLKLYAEEKHPEVRENLRAAVTGVAARAARDRLTKGDAHGAREFLELAPADAAGLLALAEFHRSQGTLNSELERAKAVKGRKSETWQLALQRAAGNLEAARDAAAAVGEERIAAAMAALAGDPLPWIRGFAGDSEERPTSAAYTALVTKRWLGQNTSRADLEPLSRLLTSRDPAERSAAMNALFLLGEVDAAEAVLAKVNALVAFQHFESLERIPEALKSIGLEPEKPDYRSWVLKRLAKLGEEDIEDQHGVNTHSEELVTLANFLERRGLHQEALTAFSEPLVALAAKDTNAFVDFLSKLFGGRETLSGAPLLAKRIAISWAGENENLWEEIVAAAFGDSDRARAWWAWLAELNPKADRTERLDGMLALFDLGADPSRQRAKWLELAWKNVAQTPEKQRLPLLERISSLALEMGDVANSLKAWDQMPEGAQTEVFWGELIVHLSAAERWNDAANLILKQISLTTEAKQETGAEVHAYAAAALRQAGRQDEAVSHDAWVDQLALGNANLAIRIGNGYAYGRDYPRAAEWWARAAREADPDSSDFVLAIKLHSDVLLEQGNWRQTAAISEVIARIYASYDNAESKPLPLMRQRLQADMARALANLKTDRQRSIEILRKCHRSFASDGSLADFFFPALRKMGLIKEHDQWFNESWARMAQVIRLYPESDNTLNTAAWFASRALRNLDAAKKLLTQALAANPGQPAYLDTMAEIHFAQGNRQKALEWSGMAVNLAPDDPQLRRQQVRFRADPLPK